MDVAFVGLGSMGKGMAGNLVKAGHRVHVWNRSRAAVDELVKLGAHASTTPREAFASDVVFAMLADDDAMRWVIDDGQLFERAPERLTLVNMATVSVALARELTERCEEHRIGYVAAPVFGRPDAAAAGKLHIVVAGDPASVARVQPLLDAMGQKIWPVGRAPYRANVVKLAGNFMIASAIATMGEAVALAESNGIKATELLEVLTNSLFTAPLYKNYGNIIADKRYSPAGFRLSLGLKDVRLALAAGEAVHAPLPIGSLLRDDFLDAIAHGQSDEDWTAVAEVARRRAGLDGVGSARGSP
jgi:3-hydroxyisobutyrate dehydrogenase-like beta-hydroxyacid dehydrogenase